MEFAVQDTFSAYRKIIKEQNIEKKYQIFIGELIAPYEGMFKAFGVPMKAQPGGYDALAMLKSWAFLMPEMLDDRAIESIEMFEKANALELCEHTMKDALRKFEDHCGRSSKHIPVGIFLLDGSKMDPTDRGYTGFGGIAGYIMLNYGEVTDYNLSRLQAALAHEAHHNLSGMIWDPVNITVGQYIIIEGLAESFAAALYGENCVGPWVADFDMNDLPRVKEIMKGALNIKGFNAVRQYVFGDAKTGSRLDIPNCAGYAVGYHIVQAFMKMTGKDIIEATNTPAEEIIKESRFFD